MSISYQKIQKNIKAYETIEKDEIAKEMFSFIPQAIDGIGMGHPHNSQTHGQQRNKNRHHPRNNKHPRGNAGPVGIIIQQSIHEIISDGPGNHIGD